MPPEWVVNMEHFFIWLIIIVVGLKALLDVLEAFNFLPDWVTTWLERNRAANTVQVLRKLGVNVDALRRKNAVSELENVTIEDLAGRTRARLANFKIDKRIRVGSTAIAFSEGFIDLMGASTTPATAKLFARELSGYWRTLVETPGVVSNAEFDFVVTPKAGAPLLGNEFAILLKKPLVLHNADKKFNADSEDFRSYFDCEAIPGAGARALLVDDSSTGGGKMVAAVEALRKFGYEVEQAIVVFEPQIKASTKENALERLKSKAVSLHSIVKT